MLCGFLLVFGHGFWDIVQQLKISYGTLLSNYSLITFLLFMIPLFKVVCYSKEKYSVDTSRDFVQKVCYWSRFFENGEHNSIILFCLLLTTNCSFFITFQTVSCAWTHLLWNYFTPKSVSDNFLAKKIFLAPYILFFKSIREGEVLSQIPLRIWECDSVILCKDALTILVTVLCFLCIPN